jgi:hypothetical protein
MSDDDGRHKNKNLEAGPIENRVASTYAIVQSGGRRYTILEYLCLDAAVDIEMSQSIQSITL